MNSSKPVNAEIVLSEPTDFVPDPAFNKFFNTFIVRRYNGSLLAFVRDLNLALPTARKWLGKSAPSTRNLRIILNSNLDDSTKHEFAETTLKWVYAKQMHYLAKGLSMGPSGGVMSYIQLENFPEDLKLYWQERYTGVEALETLNKPENDFETILLNYASQSGATFHGLIRTYWEALGKPNYHKFARVLNVARNDADRWLDPEHDDAVPLSSALQAIADSRFIQLSHKGRETLSRLARGNLVSKEDDAIAYVSLEEIQKAYAQKIAATRNFEERDKIAHELYKACLKFTGYTDYTLSERTGFHADRLYAYRSSEFFMGGINCNPEDAFNLAGAFAGDNETLKNNLAANFLNLPEYRDLKAVKKAFFLGEPMSDAFLYTRLLVKKMNRDTFCESTGMSYGPLATSETGAEKKTRYDHIIKLITTQWEPTENDLKLTLKALVETRPPEQQKHLFIQQTLPSIAKRLGLKGTKSFWDAQIESETTPAAADEQKALHEEQERFKAYYASEISSSHNPHKSRYHISFDRWTSTFTSTTGTKTFGSSGATYTDHIENLRGFVEFLINQRIDATNISLYDTRRASFVDIDELSSALVPDQFHVSPIFCGSANKEEKSSVPSKPHSQVSLPGNSSSGTISRKDALEKPVSSWSVRDN